MSNNTGSVFLDVDHSIVENNLRIRTDEEDIEKLLGNNVPEYPTKVVKPQPGFCVKTKEEGTKVKVFVNVCQTDAIPPPKDISEVELVMIMDTEGRDDFKIPMSIGELRCTNDKKGQEAKVVDIAINPAFLGKVQKYNHFRYFFLAVIFQGLLNKYDLNCVEEKILLEHKKVHGKLQLHRIQQREIAEKMGIPHKKPSMSELTGGQVEDSRKIEVLETVENVSREPEYRLYRKKVAPNLLIGEFKFPDIVNANDITVDVGEDRILIESKVKGYLLDIFVSCCIRSERCSSTFDKGLKILTVAMPLIGG